ncbi:MAG: peptidoglycan DD-metalloendopeptidase family protein [Bacteroidales bacterium]|jgi:septal ring factor EnvC (AmiA/AmiB activator)|nr:peptidoglycan DD-metalloendopeptidase family protein [Bacteroidales bacterium]
MKHALSILFLSCLCHGTLFAQSRAELEAQRKKTIEEISYVDNLLKTTSREITESIKSVSIISNKLVLRERVLSGMQQEISLLNYRIELNTTALLMMESDLAALRQDYAKAVVNSYKTMKGYPVLVYILSAKDFNQGYKRVKYLQQVAEFRRNEAEIIGELKGHIENSREKLNTDLHNVSDLRTREETQRTLLQQEQKSKQRMVQTLNNRRNQLSQELVDKKKVAARIESEIRRLIEEERKKAETIAISPEQRLISENFSDNKGRLPWPVDRGIVTSHFGVRQHPELKYLTEDNIGIEITSSGSIPAKAVFKGEVAKIFSIPGANMTVIVRHGKYLSVYANLVNIKVKTGDAISAGQALGDVFADSGDKVASVLKFMIFENDQKYLDPELWLAKK